MEAKFCFPMRIQFKHRDYLIAFVLGLHLLAATVLLLWFGRGIFLVGLCIIIMSLRYFICQQWILARYDALVGENVGRWYLVSRAGDRCSVRFERMLFLGRFGLISIKRYGAISYWLTHDSTQQLDQWHRLRVFSTFYL